MSRTIYATGAGRFTEAGKARADRAAKRREDKADRKNGQGTRINEVMFGATRANNRGEMSYQEAMNRVKPGMTVVFPDGHREKITAANKAEVLGRKGVNITTPHTNNEFGKAKGGTVERHKGNIGTGTGKDGKADSSGGRLSGRETKNLPTGKGGLYGDKNGKLYGKAPKNFFNTLVDLGSKANGKGQTYFSAKRGMGNPEAGRVFRVNPESKVTRDFSKPDSGKVVVNEKGEKANVSTGRKGGGSGGRSKK